MSKLSNAGNLYLREYYILTEAKRDLDRYLDLVGDQVYQALKEKEEKFANKHFQWHVWQNKSSRGRIDVEFKPKVKFPYFREGKADINVTYKDIRHFEKLENPETVRVSVWSPTAASGVKQAIELTAQQLHIESVYNPIFVELNTDDGVEAGERIVETILEKCELISAIFEKVANKNGI